MKFHYRIIGSVFLLLIMLVGASGQVLTPEGISSTTTETDFGQAENFKKIHTYIEDYLVNDNIKLKSVEQGKSFTIQGEEPNIACYVDQKFAQKNCFLVKYELVVRVKDKAYTMEVSALEASNERVHPGMNYMHWFDQNGQVFPIFEPCAKSTSAYFQAINADFKEYIEEGEYW